MKKFLCLFLAAFLTFSLCACSSDKDEDEKDDEKIAEKIEKDEDKDEDKDSDKDDAEDEEVVDDSEDDEIIDDSEDVIDDSFSDTPELSLGETRGNTYKNDFTGISCTLPSGWKFYSENQIMELNNLVGEYAGEELAEMLKSANVIYDMYAINESTVSTANIVLEKHDEDFYEQYTMKKIIESQISASKSTLSNMGYSNINIAYDDKIEVEGRNYEGMTISADINGMAFYSKVVCVRVGNYIVTVTVGSLNTDSTDAILDCFNF